MSRFNYVWLSIILCICLSCDDSHKRDRDTPENPKLSTEFLQQTNWVGNFVGDTYKLSVGVVFINDARGRLTSEDRIGDDFPFSYRIENNKLLRINCTGGTMLLDGDWLLKSITNNSMIFEIGIGDKVYKTLQLSKIN